jgi:hypothetical protein
VSYCAIIEFRDSVADTVQQFGNSWGGAARIWDALYNKYLKNPMLEYDNWLTDSSKPGNRRLWDLVDDSRLFDFEKAVHCATFDNFIVRRENFPRFCEHLREFSRAHPCGGVDHLPAWAAFIEKSDAEAVGFHHTSVTGNPWVSYDEEKDESVPYDLRTGDKHAEVYAELEASKEPDPC